MHRKDLIQTFFFGNYFYGFCTIGLTIEATLQQGFPLNSMGYYLFAYSATVLYYTHAYITERPPATPNPRTHWYWKNRKAVVFTQFLFSIICLLYLTQLLCYHSGHIFQLPLSHWTLLGSFPLIAGLYYGISHKRFRAFKLRNIGWLKPFIIGLVWAGLVNIYPFIFHNIENGVTIHPEGVNAFLFIKNVMFIAVLCIMFDIKDYAADHNRQLKTFVVKVGLRRTIFSILIPLSVGGLASYLVYASARQFGPEKLLINTLPFIALIAVAYSMHRRQSIFYYLVIIDGLMLVKALCGIMAMLYF